MVQTEYKITANFTDTRPTPFDSEDGFFTSAITPYLCLKTQSGPTPTDLVSFAHF